MTGGQRGLIKGAKAQLSGTLQQTEINTGLS